MKFGESLAKPGDAVELRALMDVVAAVSACPMDLNPISGFRVTGTARIARKFDMPAFLARGLLDLGLLSKREKRLGEARAHLEEARHIAEREELAILGEKIRQALGALDRPNVAA